MKTNKIKAAIESLLTELKNEILSSDEPTPTPETTDLTTVQEDLRDIRTEITYITDNVDAARDSTISDLLVSLDNIEDNVSNITSMIDDLISKLDDA